MAKTYRALMDFTCPADPESWKVNEQAHKTSDLEKHVELKSQVKWMTVKAGSKITPYSAAHEKSLLDNEVVEEVNQ